MVNNNLGYYGPSIKGLTPGAGGEVWLGTMMPVDIHKSDDAGLLPFWQRLAWIAAVWTGSVGLIVLVSLGVHALLVG